MTRIGIDVGGVIMTNANQTTDTSFFSDNYLQNAANEGAFDGVKTLVDRFGADNVFIVSKCGTNIQRKTLEWFEHHDFYTATGVKKENVYFCKKRNEKAGICEQLGITHFIDDRLEVLSYMTTVPHLYLFQPDAEEVEKFKSFLGGCNVIHSWASLILSDAGERNFAEDAKAVAALYAVGYISEDQKKFMDAMLVTPARDFEEFRNISPEDALDYARQVLNKTDPPNWAKFEYETIKVRKDLIPEGSKLVEAYETDKEIIIIGDPEDEPDDLSSWTDEQKNKWYETSHNCDFMGCGTLSHVIYRFSKKINEL